MTLQKFLGTNTDRRVAVLLIIFGSYLLVIGFDDLFLLIRRWLAECI